MVNRLLKLQSSERFADSSELFKALREKDELREEIRLLTKTFFKKRPGRLHELLRGRILRIINNKKRKSYGTIKRTI